MNAPPASAQRPAAARRLDAWEADMPTDRSHGGDGWKPASSLADHGARKLDIHTPTCEYHDKKLHCLDRRLAGVKNDCAQFRAMFNATRAGLLCPER